MTAFEGRVIFARRFIKASQIPDETRSLTAVGCLVREPAHGAKLAGFKMRAVRTTVLLNPKRGSEQYQSTNSSMA